MKLKNVRSEFDHSRAVFYYECSQCGTEFRGDFVFPNFCPNCGRKLDKKNKIHVLEFNHENFLSLCMAAAKAGVLDHPLPPAKTVGDGYEAVVITTNEKGNANNDLCITEDTREQTPLAAPSGASPSRSPLTCELLKNGVVTTVTMDRDNGQVRTSRKVAPSGLGGK